MRRLAFAALAGIVFLACALPGSDEYAGGDGLDASLPEAGPAVDAGPDLVVEAAVADAGDPYGDAVRADSPAAWYRLDDAPGSKTARDETGRHPATVEGIVTFGAPGIAGTAAHFQNEGDILLGDVFDFAGLTEYAIELWLVPEPNGSDLFVVGKRASTDSGMLGWLLYISGARNDLNFEFWGTSVFQKSNQALPSALTHVVITTRVASGMELATMYVDGVAQTNVVGGNGGPDTSQPLTIGDLFHGVLDEVAFYDKPLAQARIQAHRAAARR